MIEMKQMALLSLLFLLLQYGMHAKWEYKAGLSASVQLTS